MKQEKDKRYPPYIPLYYRIFLKSRKLLRQFLVRRFEAMSKRHDREKDLADGAACFAVPEAGNIISARKGINRCAMWMEEDLERPDVRVISENIEKLKVVLSDKGLKYTNTAGNFLPRMFYPRTELSKMWENVMVIKNSEVKSGARILDIGGASTIFSFYLASIGCYVKVIDNDWANCGTLYNANYVAKKMGWDIEAMDRDIAKGLPFEEGTFDYVFSICTIEHLSPKLRSVMMREVGRVLKKGGIAGLTMCYCVDLKEPLADKGLRFGYRDKLFEEIIKPSGLNIFGNDDLCDFQKDKDFLGTLFLQK